MPRSGPLVAAALVALAAASLLLPFAPVFDAWAWLVWGREAIGLDLDTAAGPSFKPLPVIIAAGLAPLGSAAPDGWLFVARLGWLATPVLAWRLASRLAFADRLSTTLASRLAPARVRRGRLLAGGVAALGVLLLFDPFTAWARQFAGGLSEPLLVAVVLAAIDRQLAERPGQALALATAAALLRPECWPLLVVYGAWLWRREPALRPWLVGAALAVPALWAFPDLLGSGSPLTGAARAREATGPPLGEAVEAAGRAANLVLVAIWVAAGVAVVDAWRGRERRILVLAAGSLVWIATVAALAGAGYAGLPRFAAPAAAVVCVLGGVGTVRAVAAIDGARDARARRVGWSLAGLAAIAALAQGALRASEVPGELRTAAEYERGVSQLRTLARELGPGAVRGCGDVATTEFLTETALAWQLDLPLRRVGLRLESAPERGTMFVDAGATAPARRAAQAAGRPLGERGRWSAYAISCASASAPAIAAVAGASR